MGRIKKYKIAGIILLLAVTSACKNYDKFGVDSINYYKDIPDLATETNEAHISAIDIEQILVDPSIETSFLGDFVIIDNSLFFADSYYNYVFEVQANGNVTSRNVGRGGGPDEVPGFRYIIPFNNDYCLSSGSAFNFFTKGWKKTTFSMLDWDWQTPVEEEFYKPNPTKTQGYQSDAPEAGVLQQWDENRLALTVCMENPNCNGFFGNTGFYYKYSRIFIIIDAATGKAEKTFGRRSPLYLEHKNIPNFDHLNYLVMDKNVWVNFWPDHNIYIIDKEKDEATSKFGVPGRDMNTNYRKTLTFEDAENNWREDRQDYGYYNYLLYDKERQLLFRGYTKGGEATTDGLQIYKNYNLIGDIDVPKNFKIIGYYNNELIAYIEEELAVNEDDDKLYFCKITLQYDK